MTVAISPCWILISLVITPSARCHGIHGTGHGWQQSTTAIPACQDCCDCDQCCLFPALAPGFWWPQGAKLDTGSSSGKLLWFASTAPQTGLCPNCGRPLDDIHQTISCQKDTGRSPQGQVGRSSGTQRLGMRGFSWGLDVKKETVYGRLMELSHLGDP